MQPLVKYSQYARVLKSFNISISIFPLGTNSLASCLEYG